jgi:hypothetical protein
VTPSERPARRTRAGADPDPVCCPASLDRPALQELLDDVRARKVDIILVYKADRLLISVLGCKPLPSVAR